MHTHFAAVALLGLVRVPQERRRRTREEPSGQPEKRRADPRPPARPSPRDEPLADPTPPGWDRVDFGEEDGFSEEFPEYVGSQYNDFAIARVNNTTPPAVDTTTNTPVAPGNFLLDGFGAQLTINNNFLVNLGNAAGTTYDGATPTLRAQTALAPGTPAQSVSFWVGDMGDSIYDTTLFVDNRKIAHRGSGAASSLEHAVSIAASIGVHLVQRGFTGLQLREERLWFEPRLPDELRELRFRLRYRQHYGVFVTVRHDVLVVSGRRGGPARLRLKVAGKDIDIDPGGTREVPLFRT